MVMLIIFALAAAFMYFFIMALYYREREYSVFQFLTILASLSFGGLAMVALAMIVGMN